MSLTKYWHKIGNNRVQCDVCPRYCKLKEGQRGLCFVRANENKQVVLTTYGRSSGFCIDPIEKKPLNHFYPGSAVLSFGTAGCNLACKFCQNWDISKSREWDTLADRASPEQIALAAKHNQCTSIAYTYNDPVIFLEYAIDTAIACRAQGIYSVAVTAGYICEQPRKDFFQHMDACNVDLKSFSEKFYYKITGGHLANVLETLCYIKHETHCWLEITTLLIPGENDSEQEINDLTQWIATHLGDQVPLHFTAFHPDWKMQDKPRTPAATLINARRIAMDNGLHYVYTGNTLNNAGDTHCSKCNTLLIARSGYQVTQWHLEGNECPKCHTKCVGVFDANPGHWGNQRSVVKIE